MVEDQENTIVPLTLRANFSWTFAGNVIAAVCNWAMLVALAKFGTSETVGRFALGLAVTTPVILFSNLQLRAIQATDAQETYLFRDYLGLRLVMLSLALLIITGAAFLSSSQSDLAPTIIVIGLGKAVDAVSDVVYGLLQQHEQMDRISKSLIMKGILSLVLLTLGQYVAHSILWAATGWSLASAVVLVFYDLRNGKMILKRLSLVDDSLRPRFDFHTSMRLTRLALPLGITMLMISLNTNIPRYFIVHYVGDHGLGIFAVMAALATAGTYITSALGQSATPRLARYYAAGESRAFRMLLLKLMMIAALLGGMGVLVALLVGRPMLTFLFQPEYAMHNEVFVWLMVGAGVSYFASFCGYGATAARYFKLQPLIFAACTASTIVLCAVLIPSSGIPGAAWAILLTFVVQLVLMAIYLAQSLHALSHPGPSVPLDHEQL